MAVAALWFYANRRQADAAPEAMSQPIAYVAAPSDEQADQVGDKASDELSGQHFEDLGDTGTCTQDCSGHDAGFEWAKDQGVTDASECSGDSDSFIEGCQAYAEALQQRTDELSSGEDGGEHRSDDE